MEGQLLTDGGTCNCGERKEEELPGSSGWDRKAQQELLGVLLSQGQFQQTGGSTLDRMTRLKKEEVSAAG